MSIAHLAHIFFGLQYYDPYANDALKDPSDLNAKIYSLHEHVVSFVNALQTADVNDYSYLAKLLEKLEWIRKKIRKLEKKFEGTLGAFFSLEVYLNDSQSKVVRVFKERVHNESVVLEEANHTLYLKAKDAVDNATNPFDVSETLKRYEILKGFDAHEADLFEKLATLHAELDNEIEATAYYKVAIQKNPEDRSLKERYIEYLIAIGNFTLAIQELKQFELSDCAVLQKSVDVQLGMGNFFESATLALSGICQFPKVDQFKEKFVDAYILEMERTDQGVFKDNYFLIYHYFAMKSSYLQVARTPLDSVAIALDLFDYTARRSFRAFPLFKKFVHKCLEREESSQVFSEHIQLLCDRFFERYQHYSFKIDEVLSQLKSKDFTSISDVRYFAKAIRHFTDNLLGGKLALTPKGDIPLLGFYLKLLYKQKRKTSYRETFEPLYIRLKALKENFHKVLERVNGQDCLVCLFERKKILFETKYPQENPSEEINLAMWNKRLNLFRYIETYFVPNENKDDTTTFLQNNGIDLEVLFSSRVMDFCENEHAIQEFFASKKISTIDDVKRNLL